MHGYTTRTGGVSAQPGRHPNEKVLNLGRRPWDSDENVLENRRRWLSAVRGDSRFSERLALLRQRHTDIVHMADEAFARGHRHVGDAMISATPGVLLAVQVADCLPILLADSRRRIVGAIHAGWRGLLKRVAEKTVGQMRLAFGCQPEDLRAAIGPGIGPCCYEVGAEVRDAFASQFAYASELFTEGPADAEAERLALKYPNLFLTGAPPGHGPVAGRTLLLDLSAAARRQLLDAGLSERHVHLSGFCTHCRSDLFFSYRREKNHHGLQFGFIGLRDL
jgi:YfiH family protein